MKLGDIELPLYNVGKVVATPEKEDSQLDKELGVRPAEKSAALQSRERPEPQDTPTHVIFKQDVTLPEYPDMAPMMGYTKITDAGKAEKEKPRVPRRKLGENMARSTTYQLVMRVLEEGRGRPRKNPNDPKWQKKPANGEEGEDIEGLQPDSGKEADQHIHVRLKTAADGSEKGGADITFDNNKKHFVKQNVAKTLLSALDKMKPEARNQVHGHIAQSHENLMQVHSMLTGKKQ